MAKENSKKKQVTTVNSTSTGEQANTAGDNGADEIKLKLGKWISKIFKIEITKANLISKALISICGSVVTIASVVLALLGSLGVI